MLLNKIRPNWMHIHSLKDKPFIHFNHHLVKSTIGRAVYPNRPDTLIYVIKSNYERAA